MVTTPRALLVENVHSRACDLLADAGYEVEALTGALDERELIERLAGVDVLGIRSATQVTERVLAGAAQLQAIGAFCIGTNQIALDAASDVASPSSTPRTPTPAPSSSWWSAR